MKRAASDTGIDESLRRDEQNHASWGRLGHAELAWKAMAARQSPGSDNDSQAALIDQLTQRLSPGVGPAHSIDTMSGFSPARTARLKLLGSSIISRQESCPLEQVRRLMGTTVEVTAVDFVTHHNPARVNSLTSLSRYSVSLRLAMRFGRAVAAARFHGSYDRPRNQASARCGREHTCGDRDAIFFNIDTIVSRYEPPFPAVGNQHGRMPVARLMGRESYDMIR
jgi:hypothetical protein